MEIGNFGRKLHTLATKLALFRLLYIYMLILKRVYREKNSPARKINNLQRILHLYPGLPVAYIPTHGVRVITILYSRVILS